MSDRFDRAAFVRALLNPDLDMQATAVRLAQELPSTFLKMAVYKCRVDTRLQRCIDLLKSDPEHNYVPSIKLHRELFGTSLYDAKTAMEQERAKLRGLAVNGS